MKHEIFTGAEALSPRIDTAQRFIKVMKSAHVDRKPRLSRNQASELAKVLMDIEDIAPEVRGNVLQRAVEENPFDLLGSCSTIHPGGLDFDVIAANWDDPRFAHARDIAETHFHMSETEIDFLRSGLGLSPLEIAASTDFVDPTGLDF